MRVDIESIIKQKNPGLAKALPGFVMRYIKKTLHESELNYYLDSFSHLPSIGFVRASLAEMKVTSSIIGLDNLSKDGRYIFASNHPLGGMDGLMLADKIHAHFGDAKVIVNDLLMNIEPLKDIFVAVNKHGKQGQEYAKRYNEAFESDIPIITFPAGLCSRRQKGLVRDVEWRHSFIKQAIATKRDIVPTFVQGRLSSFFYNLSNIRKNFGVKANIEMFYLVNEMYKQSGRHFDIYVGEPIEWRELAEENPRKVAQQIKEMVYSMDN